MVATVPSYTPIADRPWALSAGIAGILALACYAGALVVPGPVWLQVALVFGFAFGLTLSSLGLYWAVCVPVSTRLGLAAAVSNIVAAGLLSAMLLVQLAVKTVEPSPGRALGAVWLGLDVAWDLYIGAGTLLFALAFFRRPGFRRLLAPVGVLIAAMLIGLNVATFPTPPAESGLFDAGPLVGLWYLLVAIQVLRLALRAPART